jgi:hypothetical protein
VDFSLVLRRPIESTALIRHYHSRKSVGCLQLHQVILKTAEHRPILLACWHAACYLSSSYL